jgi:hypothetical protein
MWEKVLCRRRLPKFAYTLKSAAAVALNYDERVLKFQLNAAAASIMMAKEKRRGVCAAPRSEALEDSVMPIIPRGREL